MLDTGLQTQLRTYFTKLRRPIRLIATLNESDAARDMKALLTEVAALSDRITYEEVLRTDVSRPSFQITSTEREIGIHFAALPMGHEFSSFVLALLQAGGHPGKAGEDTLATIRSLRGPLSFEVFISLSCHNCPDVVQALNLMAVENPSITVTTIDGALAQEEAKARRVMAVPTVFLNGEPFTSGRKTLEEIVAVLDKEAEKRTAEKLSASAPYDVLVVGGGPAGATAAIYAARKGLRTGLLCERLGGQLHETSEVANFTSILSLPGERLASNIDAHIGDYPVERHTAQRAASVSRDGEFWVVHTESGAHLRTRTLIAATGARWRRLEVPGEEEWLGRGVAFCPHCDGPLFRGKRVAVIGGGNSGVEAAIDLAGIAEHVTLLHRSAALKADKILQKKIASLPNVTVLTEARTKRLEGADGVLSTLVYEGADGRDVKIPVAGVFVQIGLTPNTAWLADTVDRNEYGEVTVDARCATSASGLFAAGDCTDVPFKQIVIAMGEGAKASLSAFDHLIRSDVA